MKRQLGMRLLSLFLALALCVQFLPEPALAYLAEQADGLILTGADGREIVIDESWEEKFPYGTFAFQNSELKIEEGGEPGVLQVYRLGGTTGRAVAYPGRFLPEEFHMYDVGQLAETILDSIQKTLQEGFTLEGGDPDALDIWYFMEGEKPLELPGLGLSWPIDQPYKWAGAKSE